MYTYKMIPSRYKMAHALVNHPDSGIDVIRTNRDSARDEALERGRPRPWVEWNEPRKIELESMIDDIWGKIDGEGEGRHEEDNGITFLRSAFE